MIDINEIIKTLQQAKEKKARYEGSLQRIMDDLKNKYGASSIEEARQMLADIEKQNELDIEKQNVIIKKINESVDWSRV